MHRLQNRNAESCACTSASKSECLGTVLLHVPEEFECGEFVYVYKRRCVCGYLKTDAFDCGHSLLRVFKTGTSLNLKNL